jgi:hypothetical protein
MICLVCRYPLGKSSILHSSDLLSDELGMLNFTINYRCSYCGTEQKEEYTQLSAPTKKFTSNLSHDETAKLVKKAERV